MIGSAIVAVDRRPTSTDRSVQAMREWLPTCGRGLLASGRSTADILSAYPYLQQEDIDQSLAYAAWRLEEREAPLPVL